MHHEATIGELVRHAILVSAFVFAMMTIVDYANVLSRGRLGAILRRGGTRQYVGAALLGATPGCLGAFAVTSLYIHRMLSFGALVACMLATSGDEAFVMLALFPGRALALFGILFVLGAAWGWLSDRAAGAAGLVPCDGCDRLAFHEEHCCRLSVADAARNLRRPSLARFCIFLIIAIFLSSALAGGGHGEAAWVTTTLILLLVAAAFIAVTVPDHYLEEHLWEHLAKEHLWRIFLWVLGTMLAIHFLSERWDLEAFIGARTAWVLPVAVLLGFIPESGPHLVFVLMYARGLVPFSVLLASSISQDGHGMLPLLSASVRDFVWVKAAKVAAALLVGFIALAAGF
ncbi:MAG: putative manganese transporter [bacterium]|nr:putative manganese transporter [bacterium]